MDRRKILYKQKTSKKDLQIIKGIFFGNGEKEIVESSCFLSLLDIGWALSKRD